MLPFLKKPAQTGLVIEQTRKPDAPESKDESGNAALEAAAQDILRAISAKDFKHLALAIQAAYDICESSESDDDYESKHDYDSQNIKAAQGQE